MQYSISAFCAIYVESISYSETVELLIVCPFEEIYYSALILVLCVRFDRSVQPWVCGLKKEIGPSSPISPKCQPSARHRRSHQKPLTPPHRAQCVVLSDITIDKRDGGFIVKYTFTI